MASFIVRRGTPDYSDNYYEYVCDTSADIANLPHTLSLICPGSKAFSVADSKTYMFTPAGTWKEITV